MKRLLAGLLCIGLVLLGTAAIAGLAKKGPFFIVVKTYTTAEAAALVTTTGMPLHYVNSTDGLPHYVTAAGVDYALTDTGTIGGSGNSWWGSDTSGTLATGQTVYVVGTNGVSVAMATSGASPVVFYVGLSNVYALATDSGATQVDTDTGHEAVVFNAGGIYRIGIHGSQGIQTDASGGSVWVLADGVHSQVTSYVQSQVSQYPYASQVTSWFADGVTAFPSGVSTSGISIYHNTTFGPTPLYITTDQDGIAGITVQTTVHQGKIGIALRSETDANTWRIVLDGADGNTLKFIKGTIEALEVDTTGTASAGSFNASGNITGSTLYSHDSSGVNGIGGIVLSTQSAGGNSVTIKIPGQGLLPGDYVLTLPMTTGVSGQLLSQDGAGNWTWTSDLNVESISNVAISEATITNSTVVAGTSVWVVNTAAPETATANMMGGNPVDNTVSYKVINLPSLTASSATPFYYFADPPGSGISVVAPNGGCSIYVYDPVRGLPRYVAGTTVWAHPGGGPGQEIIIRPSWSAVTGWHYSMFGMTGVSLQMVINNNVIAGKTWIGCLE